MLGRLNQRLKGKSEVGDYNDLDRDVSMDSGSGQHRAVSPLSSFGFAVNADGGLGSAIELSAAGAGVVPDGESIVYILSPAQHIACFNRLLLLFYFHRHIHSRPGCKCNR